MLPINPAAGSRRKQVAINQQQLETLDKHDMSSMFCEVWGVTTKWNQTPWWNHHNSKHETLTQCCFNVLCNAMIKYSKIFVKSPFSPLGVSSLLTGIKRMRLTLGLMTTMCFTSTSKRLKYMTAPQHHTQQVIYSRLKPLPGPAHTHSKHQRLIKGGTYSGSTEVPSWSDGTSS